MIAPAPVTGNLAAGPLAQHLRQPHSLQDHRTWWVAAAAFAVLAAILLVLPLLDARQLSGVSVWTKPFKFAVSLSVYFATLAWFAPLFSTGYFATRSGRLLTWVALLSGVFEMGYILLQASLGEHSHFNVATPVHALMYSLMGVGATLLVSVCLWLGVSLLRRYRLRDAYVLAVALGLILTFVLGGGFGGYLSSQGGHWVGGTPSDQVGVWLLRWSRDGGDLRVAHFFGIHAMQVLPLLTAPFAAGGTRAPTRGASARPLLLAWVFTLACVLSIFSTFTFVQAITGQPF